jgi:carbamoyl-phosphate synthase large subunit
MLRHSFLHKKFTLETIRRIKNNARQILVPQYFRPFNIQFLARDNYIKVIECNLRSSRSFPFVSKVLKINFIEIATKIMLVFRCKNRKIGFRSRLCWSKSIAVLIRTVAGQADPILGVDMASTGEVGCLGDDSSEALLKSFAISWLTIPKKNILISSGEPKSKVDLLECLSIALQKRLSNICYTRTHQFLMDNGIATYLRSVARRRRRI